MPQAPLPKILFSPLWLSGFIILAYLASYLGIPLSRPFYLLTAVTVTSLLLWHYRLISIRFNPKPRHLLMLMPSLLTFAMLLLGFRGYVTPPNNHDVPNHYFIITQILTSQSLKLDRVLANGAGNTWYMFGLHTLLAGIVSLTGITDVNHLFPIVWALTTLYPLAIYYFSSHLTHRPRLGILAAFISVTFPMFPANVFGWGGWPFTLGIILMYFTLGEVHRLITLKSKPKLLTLIPLFILANGLFLTHTTEVVILGILTLPLLFTAKKALLALAKASVPLVAANLILLIPFLRSSTHWINSPLKPSDFDHQSFGATANILSYIHTGFNHDYLYALLALLGIYLLVKHRRYFVLRANLFSLYLLWALRNTSSLLDYPNQRLFPLFEPDRLYAYLGGILAPITAYAAIKLVARFTAKTPANSRRPLRLSLTLLLVSAGLVLPFTQNIALFKHNMAINTTLTHHDIALIRRSQSACPRYLNDDLADAGRLIPYVSSSDVILPALSAALPDYRLRLDLLNYLPDPAQIDQVCSLQTQFPFDCIYVGALDTYKARKTLHADQLLQHPNLTLLDEEGGSAIFTLNCPSK